jgi:branched-chain amino acid transport system permease protein
MDLLIERIFDGLGNGAIYGSLALAVVLIFRTTGTINLAQGAMGTFCTFIAWKLSAAGGLSWPIVPAIIVAVLAGFFGGAALERVFVRPVERERSHLPMIIVTLALSLAIEALAGHFFSLQSVALRSPFPLTSLKIGGVNIPWQSLCLLAVMLVVATLMWFLFQHTQVGLKMRAAVDNPESARLSGIRSSRMLMLGWGMAGALGALAGCLIAPQTFVNSSMLDGVLLYSFAAATLGGFDSPPGAVVGGLIIGVLQVLVSSYVGFVGNQLGLLVALVAIVAVLMVRPSGFFGHVDARRL